MLLQVLLPLQSFTQFSPKQNLAGEFFGCVLMCLPEYYGSEFPRNKGNNNRRALISKVKLS